MTSLAVIVFLAIAALFWSCGIVLILVILDLRDAVADASREAAHRQNGYRHRR